MDFKQKCLFIIMHYHLLLHSSAICMGHSITCKEAVKYFLRIVNLLLVGFILKIAVFFFPSSSKKKIKGLKQRSVMFAELLEMGNVQWVCSVSLGCSTWFSRRAT